MWNDRTTEEKVWDFLEVETENDHFGPLVGEYRCGVAILGNTSG